MTFWKKCFFLFLFVLTGTVSVAQQNDSLLRLYNNQTITRYGSNFRMGTERLSFTDLQNKFSFSPAGLVGYELAKKQRTTATVLRLLSVAASIATLTLLSRENRTGTYLAWAGQIGLNVAGFYYQERGNKLLDEALWQRNRDLLFRR